MDIDFTQWLPAGLSPLQGAMLLALSTVTSMITATLGAGGGLILLAVMSMLLNPAAVIPVHGTIQLGSNLGRATMAWRHIAWRTMLRFLPGAIVGALLAALLLVRLPDAVWQLTIGVFVLYLCWGPGLPPVATGTTGIVLFSAATTFLTHFVGATGPLVSAFIKQLHRQRQTIVATMAAAMTLQHGVKAISFGATGFNFAPWIAFIAAMIAFGVIGTWVGLHLLKKWRDDRFQQALNILLTLLALRLLWLGASALL